MVKIFNKLKFPNNITNNHNNKNVNNDTTIHYNRIINAIDNKNKKKIKILFNKNNKQNIKKNIVYELYKENELNSERLQFIINNCTIYMNISSSLIKKLMNDNNKELLEILFKNYLKFLIMPSLLIY